jgi:hypothetical protein
VRYCRCACYQPGRRSLLRLLPRPSSRCVANVPDNQFVGAFIEREEDAEAKASDIFPSNALLLGLLRRIRMTQKLANCVIDAVDEIAGNGGRMLKQIVDRFAQLAPRGGGLADLHVRAERAFVKMAAICSSLAKRPARTSSALCASAARSSSLSR